MKKPFDFESSDWSIEGEGDEVTVRHRGCRLIVLKAADFEQSANDLAAVIAEAIKQIEKEKK